MAILIEEGEASKEVLAVYADIKATRKTDWINNFWKALANHPATLKRIWENIKQVMAPGALDLLTKELVYIAVSVTNNCGYCIASHTAAARAKGMTEEQLAELFAVIGLANENNRLAIGYGVPVDEKFLSAGGMANNFSQAERMEKCARRRANWKRQTLSGAACRRSTWSWTAQSRIAERNRSRA